MGDQLVADGGVVVTYTVSPAPAPTTTVPLAPPAPPAVTHHPLPLTGAPITGELIGSFGLLLAGAMAAFSAHRSQRANNARRTGWNPMNAAAAQLREKR